MINLTYTFSAVAVILAIALLVALFWPLPGRRKSSPFLRANMVALTAFSLAMMGGAVWFGQPDAKPAPLERLLPAGWERVVAQAPVAPAATFGEHFTSDAVAKADRKTEIVVAARSSSAVKAYLTVEEGSADEMADVIAYHIRQSGGDVLSANRGSVLAAVPASYAPCLESLADLQPSQRETPGYRAFAQQAVSGPTQCPHRNGDSAERTVLVTISERTVGWWTDLEDAQMSTLPFIFILPFLGVSLAHVVQDGRPRIEGAALRHETA